jgi:hypothetical protein
MNHWLKAVGHARGPAPNAWVEEWPGTLRRTGFPRRPRMQPGDRLIYYASVWRVVFAAVEVASEPEITRPGTRWPWTVAVEPLLAIPQLDRAPPVEAIGVPARSMSQQSHIRLSPDKYAHAIEVMTSVAS